MIIAAGIGVEGRCSAFSIGDEPRVEPPIGLLFVICSVMVKGVQGCRRLLLGGKLTRLSKGHMIWRVFRATCAPLVHSSNILSHHGISTTKSSIP